MIGVVVAELILSALLFLVSPYFFQFSPLYTPITKAVAVVHPTQGNSAAGIVKFSQETGGVRVQGSISGLTPGKHGFHIHALGDCGCPDAVCAGDHYNPSNQPHGAPSNMHRHAGDFGNIEADENGVAQIDFLDTVINLNGRHSIIGRSVIIHADPDDLISQPTGNAGARIGCGSIGIGK